MLLVLPLACAFRAPGAFSRRHALTAGACTACAPAAAARAVALAELDLKEVVTAAAKIDTALEEWEKEVSFMQMRKPGRLSQAVDALSDAQCDAIAAGLGGKSDAYKKHKNSMLTFLFLASGANQYESAAKGMEYMLKAKEEAIAAREVLAEIASARGVQLKGRDAPPPAAAAPAAAGTGWAAYTAPDGRTYYYNAATAVSTWERPGGYD